MPAEQQTEAGIFSRYTGDKPLDDTSIDDIPMSEQWAFFERRGYPYGDQLPEGQSVSEEHDDELFRAWVLAQQEMHFGARGGPPAGGVEPREAAAEGIAAQVGYVLRTARLRRLRTVEDVAGEAGITPEELRRIERGDEADLSIRTVATVCFVLGYEPQIRVVGCED